MESNQGKNFFCLWENDNFENYQNYDNFNLQNSEIPPQNSQFTSQNTQMPQYSRPNDPFQLSPNSQLNTTAILISDHESENRTQTNSSNSLGRNALERINLNDDFDLEELKPTNTEISDKKKVDESFKFETR